MKAKIHLQGGNKWTLDSTALVAGAEVYLTTGSGIRRIAGMSVVNVEDHVGKSTARA